MYAFFIIATALSWIVMGVGAWLGWQLLRQNGRILLRLDELEKQLHELEFGEADDEPRSSRGDEALTEESAMAIDGRSARFTNRSLARSRINRDGLKAGTPAPDFRLPRLDGGELALTELHGKRVFLVFSDPHCGPCAAVAPELQKFHREHPEIVVLMISRGEPKENRAKAKEHGLTFPIVLQQRWEISRLYAMFATPIAYLIDERGIITKEVAVGVEPILALIDGAKESFQKSGVATINDTVNEFSHIV